LHAERVVLQKEPLAAIESRHPHRASGVSECPDHQRLIADPIAESDHLFGVRDKSRSLIVDRLPGTRGVQESAGDGIGIARLARHDQVVRGHAHHFIATICHTRLDCQDAAAERLSGEVTEIVRDSDTEPGRRGGRSPLRRVRCRQRLAVNRPRQRRGERERMSGQNLLALRVALGRDDAGSEVVFRPAATRDPPLPGFFGNRAKKGFRRI
jgi:hypothetical protein